MKRLAAISALVLVSLVWNAVAEGPDSEYLRIYTLIQEGDQTSLSGLARQKYLDAQAALTKLQGSYPNWNPAVVQFRLDYVARKLAPATPAGSGVQLERPARPADPRDAEVAGLTEQIRRLEGEKAILEAKLKEALAAQPAAIDPRELTQAQEEIRALKKQNDVLNLALEQEKSKGAATDATEPLRAALAETTQKLQAQTDLVRVLTQERDILRKELADARQAPAPAPSRPQTPAASAPAVAVPAPAPAPAPEAGSAAFKQELQAAQQQADERLKAIGNLQEQLRALQEEKSALELSRKELEARLASLPSAPARPAVADGDRVRRLEKERDDLLKKLNETTKQLYDNRAKSETVQREQSKSEFNTLRARLDVFEARKVPYSPEELALFKQPPVTIAAAADKPAKKTARELPRNAVQLLTEAERAFKAKRYEEAEQKYQEALRIDDKNVFTLANLAAIQLEQNRLEPAEANLKRALEEEADDAYSLSLFGILRFRQQKLDEALDALSRSAQLDPKNAETQNYLGISLSQKGQRGPAETALRKAVQLAPGYAGAHHNLAVVYAFQKPPFTELARWHYRKALALGHEQNPELEKAIEASGAAPAAQ
jgi:Flp pilus assembly protein TadD/predicted  nucleic acid-binding Zn-ribbon protein